MNTRRKEYASVLEILGGKHTVAQFHAKLKKWFLTTEDIPLRGLIGVALSKLNQARDTPDGERLASVKVTLSLESETCADLVNYCETQLDRGKPQWETLAERSGWRAPVDKV